MALVPEMLLHKVITVEYGNKLIRSNVEDYYVDNLRFDMIGGKEFLIKVELLPKASDPLDSQELWLKLELDPLRLFKITPPALS